MALAARTAPGQAPTRYPYVATPVLEFKYEGKPPMLLPTAVALGRDGTVYVADGVHDRILVFAETGVFRRELREIDGRTFSRPMSVKLDAADQLWVVDTGNCRVLVRAADGALAREIRWPGPEQPQSLPDITDVAMSADGRYGWLVDNDHDRLARLGLETGEFRFFGKHGLLLGQLHYPFMLALNSSGELFVSEALNGRVQIFNAEGRPTGSVGAYGADLGNLHRPKGIALDADGNVWVADGTFGVIQVFGPDGRVRDVLRDATGKPLKLETPCGIALNQTGDLYVAELSPNRVRKFAIAVDRQARPARPEPGRSTAGVVQPRTCTVCHVEWLGPLVRGISTVLTAPPVSPREQPAVSRPQTCLSCHDGSVVDSRGRVWGGRGHPTGIPPPMGMTVASDLPLVGGKIACRTCHMAHTRGTPGESFAEAVFLRVKEDPAELCVGCHADFAGGAGAGTHPLGNMSIATPDVLVRGRKAAPAGSVTCLACHAGHGAPQEAQLVLALDANELCLSCHQSLTPVLFGDETRNAHGRLPRLNEARRNAAMEFRTWVGPNGELLCVTCHKVHRAVTARYLLAFDPAHADACGACHSEQRRVIGSSHDLRTSFPQERNVLGITAEAGGACSACHGAHQATRRTEPGPLDPTGRCRICHAEGQLADCKPIAPLNHPPAACLGCHNPHEPRFGDYLAARPSDRCRECHAAYATVAGGTHDVTHHSEAWPAASVATHDICLACHRPHGNAETGLFRAGLAASANRADAACLACHAAPTPNPQGDLTPGQTGVATLPAGQATRPLVPAGTGHPPVGCNTCHNPHAGPGAAPHLLRLEGTAAAQQLCLTCHTDQASIQVIGHAESYLRAAGFRADACQPCHVVHGGPQVIEPQLLWPRDLAGYRPGDEPGAAANQRCVACHRVGGPVPPPAIATHPEVDMFNPQAPDAPGYLPLFNEQGNVDPSGAIACRTCHLTHGRKTPAPTPPDSGALSTRELRARQWHVRAFVPTNVCSTCHGFDALRRFMYFHDVTRRTGPLQGPSSSPSTTSVAP